jgi:transcriptional antiterminator NusG
MRNQWFIIQTLSGQEHKVKDSIEKRVKTDEMQDFVKEVLVPMEKVVEVRNQKKTVSNRKLWPGYVFVDMVLLDDEHRVIEKPWYFIRETQGVIGFLSDPPQPTPTEEVDAIKMQISASEETEKPKVNFAVGETVKINNGPFLNFSGVIEEIDPERGKLKVTVNFSDAIRRWNWNTGKSKKLNRILWQRKLQDKSNCRFRPVRPIPRRPSAPRSVSTASTSWASAKNLTP